jgi:hypothetical protein
MLVEKRVLGLAEFASKDTTRFVLNGVCLKPGFAEATDGHVLARVPLGEDATEDFPALPDGSALPELTLENPVTLPAAFAKEVLKALPKKHTFPILESAAMTSAPNGDVSLYVTDLTTPKVLTSKTVEGEFPKTEPIWEGVKANDGATVGMDIALLKRVITYLEKFGEKKKSTHVSLTFDKESPGTKGMLVEAKLADGADFEAVVMPVRLPE